MYLSSVILSQSFVALLLTCQSSFVFTFYHKEPFLTTKIDISCPLNLTQGCPEKNQHQCIQFLSRQELQAGILNSEHCP